MSGRNAATSNDKEGINKTQTFSPQNYDNNQPEIGKKRLAERRNYGGRFEKENILTGRDDSWVVRTNMHMGN